MLEDEPAIVDRHLPGRRRGGLRPDPVGPRTPFTPSNSVKPAYPYNPAKAVSLLKAHGWHVVPNGQTTCANAGQRSDECGAGIPKGTPLSFTWFYTQTAASGPFVALIESEAFASEAKQAAGINVQLAPEDVQLHRSNFNDADPSVAKYINAWGVDNFGGFTDNDYYPTQNSIFNTGGSFNSGDYNDPKVDQLINDVRVRLQSERRHEGGVLLRPRRNPPCSCPTPTDLLGVSNKVGGPPDVAPERSPQYAVLPAVLVRNKK